MKFITLTLVRRLPNIKGSKKNFDMYLVCSVFFEDTIELLLPLTTY